MTVVINGTTGVSGVAGSASTPALIGADADSGYYINSANEPNASVNGTAVWSAASTFGFKNRIINGAMVIDQRNAGASVTNTAGTIYTLDRWQATGSQASKFTIQQNAGAVTPPAGFVNYLGVTSSSAYTLSGNDYFSVAQQIEANNISDFGLGAAGAATFTLSFWVRSSLTGSFGGSFQNSAENRCYSFAYTISSANTWEYKTVTVTGDTTGTWLTGNSSGMFVWFGLGATGIRVGTAGSWGTQSGAGLQPSGTVSVVGTNGATFYVTGVQLEKGSTATSFDYRPYGTELQLCQRYYYRLGNAEAVRVAPGYCYTTTTAEVLFQFPVPMRIAPQSLEQTGTAGDYSVRYNATATLCSAVPTFSTTSPYNGSVTMTIGSALFTVGGGCFARPYNATAYFGFSAEL